MKGLEQVYRSHHEKRGENFAILSNERGSFLKKHIGTDKAILDIGCRDGQLTSTYATGNMVTGADIDSVALDSAATKLGIKTVHADLNGDWPFEKQSYDVVVACEFLEHVYFPQVIYAKVSEVLKPGGMFIGTVPHAYSLQSRIKFLLGIKTGTPLEDPTHINHFTYKEFRGGLEKNFKVIAIETYVPPRYRFLANFFPYLFAHDFMFVATKK